MYFLRYNNIRLDQDGYEIHDLDSRDLPEVRLNKYTLARSDGEKVTGINYGAKKITVKGRIYSTSTSDMETKLENLKIILSAINKNLDIEVSGVIRRYTASVEALETNINGYSCEFTIKFTCDAFGVSVDADALTIASPITSALVDNVNTFGGSFTTKPSFDFTVTSCLPYWTASYLEITNNVLAKRMRFNRQWTWGDRVIVNGATKTVTYYPSTNYVISTCDSTTGWTSSHTLSLETTTKLEGNGSLKLVMAGAAILLTLNRLNATAIDLSSTTGKVLLPIFIPTPTAGAVSSIDFKIGSDATLASNYCYYRKTTQYNGSALATNAWNYLEIDLSASPTSTTGSPTRTAIKSIAIEINGVAATMQLNGVLVDYITRYKPGIVSQPLDYEGIFPEFAPGLGTVRVANEFTACNITMTGSYIKRYL